MKVLLLILLSFSFTLAYNSAFRINNALSRHTNSGSKLSRLRNSKLFAPIATDPDYHWYRVYVEKGKEMSIVESIEKASKNPNHIFYKSIVDANLLLKSVLKTINRRQLEKKIATVDENQITSEVECLVRPISPCLVYMKMVNSPKLFKFLESKVENVRGVFKKNDEYVPLSTEEEEDLLKTFDICSRNMEQVEKKVNKLSFLCDVDSLKTISAPELVSTFLHAQSSSETPRTCFAKVLKKSHIIYSHLEDKIGIITDVKKRKLTLLFQGSSGYFTSQITLDSIEPYFPSEGELNTWCDHSHNIFY